MIIYCIENMVNHKKYFGKANDFYVRLNKHIREIKNGTNRYLYDAIRKYGINNFTAYIVENCIDNSNEREKFYILKYKTNDKNYGYNMTWGGDGGNTYINFSNNKKRKIYDKIVKSRKWYKHSLETKQKISESGKGKIISDVQKKKISEKLIKKIKSGLFKPNCEKIILMSKTNHPMKGRKHSLETRKKMSIIKIGKKRKLSLETKEKMYDRFKGENNPMYKNIHINDIIKLIKMKYNAEKIGKELDCSKGTIYDKVKKTTNKTFGKLQKEILNGN